MTTHQTRASAPPQIFRQQHWACGDTSAVNTAQAHRVMQQHHRCDTGTCPRRTSAVRHLVRAGALTPDSHRPGHLELLHDDPADAQRHPSLKDLRERTFS